MLGGAALITAMGTLFRPSKDAEELELRQKRDRDDLERKLDELRERVKRLESGRGRVYRYERDLRSFIAGIFKSMGVSVHSDPEGPALEELEMLPSPLTKTLKRGAPLVQPRPAIPSPPHPEHD